MNTRQEYKEDLLIKFINPDRIEKAPEGFTAKVMTRIQIEIEPVKSAGRFRNKNLVPVISASITILLVVSAFLIPARKDDSLGLPLGELIKNIKIFLPDIDLTSVFSANIPALLVYVFVGILILSLFDRVLNIIFHRKK